MDDLDDIAREWSKRVSEHRRKLKLYGKVSTAIVDTPDGCELHLIEETTFRAAAGVKCALDAALKWMAARREDRARNGSEGHIRHESEQKNGTFVFAKVIEVTVISRKALDAKTRRV